MTVSVRLSLSQFIQMNRLPLLVPRLGAYKHYKGDRYVVISNWVIHTETQESMVLYRDKNYNKFVRPTKMFLSTVKWGEKIVPRFTYLDKEITEMKLRIKPS